MFKKIIIGISLLLFSTSVLATSDYYLIKSVSAPCKTSQTKKATIGKYPVVSIGAGYRFADHFAVELTVDHPFIVKYSLSEDSFEFTSKKNNLIKISRGKGFNTKITNLGLSLVSNYPINDKFSIFANGGIGSTFFKTKVTPFITQNKFTLKHSSTYTKNYNSFSYKIGGGASFNLANHLTANISYNYVDLGKNKIPSLPKRYDFHLASIGIKVDL